MSFNTNPSTTSSYYDGSQYIPPSTNSAANGNPSNQAYLQQVLQQQMNGSQTVPVQSVASTQQVDPLAAVPIAQQLRNFLYTNGNVSYNQANNFANQYGMGTQAAYNNPVWDKANQELMNVSPGMQQANNLNQNTMSGQYLAPSSYLKNAIQSAQATAERNAADQNALLKGKMASNGMSFSTADQQAQMSSSAAQRSNATNAATQAYAQNYANERGLQNGAINNQAQLQQARNSQLGLAGQMQGQRAGLMQNAAAVQMQPLTSYASLLDYSKAGTTGLENIQQKTPLDYAMLMYTLNQQQQYSPQSGYGTSY